MATAKLGTKINVTIIADAAKEMVIAAVSSRKGRDGYVDADEGKKLGEAFVACWKAIVEGDVPA